MLLENLIVTFNNRWGIVEECHQMRVQIQLHILSRITGRQFFQRVRFHLFLYLFFWVCPGCCRHFHSSWWPGKFLSIDFSIKSLSLTQGNSEILSLGWFPIQFSENMWCDINFQPLFYSPKHSAKIYNYFLKTVDWITKVFL